MSKCFCCELAVEIKTTASLWKCLETGLQQNSYNVKLSVFLYFITLSNVLGEQTLNERLISGMKKLDLYLTKRVGLHEL